MDKKINIIGFRVGDELYRQTEAQAFKERRSLSQIVRLALESYLRQTSQSSFGSPKTLSGHRKRQLARGTHVETQ